MDQGAQFTEAIEAHLREAHSSESSPLTLNWLENGYRQFASGFDPEEGGFSSAPKFPRPAVFNFLLRYWQRTQKTSPFDMVEFTLRKMARGGIYDHLGGGFHRYSVDDRWHVPHFEKMLYDQAQLAVAYTEMVQATADPELRTNASGNSGLCPARSHLARRRFLLGRGRRQFPAGGSSETNEKGRSTFGRRRKLIVCSRPDESLIFRRMYGVERAGNVVTASDPHR